MSFSPTMAQIEKGLLSSIERRVYNDDDETTEVVGHHDLLHIRFGPGYLDCKASLVVDAWLQIKKVVDLLSTGIEDPKDHRAEALLLMIFQDMYYHGYTPKEEVKE
jgi:hypothetical protein